MTLRRREYSEEFQGQSRELIIKNFEDAKKELGKLVKLIGDFRQAVEQGTVEGMPPLTNRHLKNALINNGIYLSMLVPTQDVEKQFDRWIAVLKSKSW